MYNSCSHIILLIHKNTITHCIKHLSLLCKWICMDGHIVQHNILQGSIFLIHRLILHLVQCVESIDYMAKHRVHIVQMRLLLISNEKLWFVIVLLLCGHTHYSSLIMLEQKTNKITVEWQDEREEAYTKQIMKLIFKWTTPNTLTTLSSTYTNI